MKINWNKVAERLFNATIIILASCLLFIDIYLKDKHPFRMGAECYLIIFYSAQVVISEFKNYKS